MNNNPLKNDMNDNNTERLDLFNPFETEENSENTPKDDIVVQELPSEENQDLFSTSFEVQEQTNVNIVNETVNNSSVAEILEPETASTDLNSNINTFSNVDVSQNQLPSSSVNSNPVSNNNQVVGNNVPLTTNLSVNNLNNPEKTNVSLNSKTDVKKDSFSLKTQLLYIGVGAVIMIIVAFTISSFVKGGTNLSCTRSTGSKLVMKFDKNGIKSITINDKEVGESDIATYQTQFSKDFLEAKRSNDDYVEEFKRIVMEYEKSNGSTCE